MTPLLTLPVHHPRDRVQLTNQLAPTACMSRARYCREHRCTRTDAQVKDRMGSPTVEFSFAVDDASYRKPYKWAPWQVEPKWVLSWQTGIQNQSTQLGSGIQ